MGIRTAIRTGWAAACAVLAASGAAADDATSLEQLRARLEAVVEQNQAMQRRIDALEGEVRSARDEARAARERLDAGGFAANEDRRASPPVGGPARFQLMDVSLDVLTSAGFSSARDEDLKWLQAGDHDPRQRGFSIPNVELSFVGAVDPFLTGEVHLIWFLDPEGESRFELEEAFVQTQVLPFGLERRGLQLEVGHFFTEFGRTNPAHPHAWHWQDQPLILSRFFGADGMRNPGVRAAWLLPLPWFSELHLGAQNAQGETMVSFLASEEVFEERPIAGRPFRSAGVRSPRDLVYLARWLNGFDLSETLAGQVGISGLHGPNATGSDARTWIVGADLVLKWMPLTSDRGWPFLTLEAELMGRRYEADAFFGCPGEPVGAVDCAEPLALASDTLRDWGGYAQVLWGFRRGWAGGLRYEVARGSGESLGAFRSRSDDPFRDDRQRISPLLVWYPSEFSRVRFQYNYDRAEFLDDDDAHSVWVGLEFLFGSHPAHRF